MPVKYFKHSPPPNGYSCCPFEGGDYGSIDNCCWYIVVTHIVCGVSCFILVCDIALRCLSER